MRGSLVAVLVDALLSTAAIGIAARARFGASIPALDMEELRHLLPFLLLIRLGSLQTAGLYRRSFAHPRGLDFADLLRAWAVGSIILAAAVFFGRFLETSRLLLIYEAALNGAFLVGWRSGITILSRVRRPIRPALLIGAESLGHRLNRFLEIDGWDLRITRIVPTLAAWSTGDEEAIFLPLREVNARLLDHSDSLAVYAIPEAAEMIGAAATPCHLGGQVLFEIGGVRRHRNYLALKRAGDLVVASIGLALATPLILAAAAAVRLTSPGPALFLQKRIGHQGVPFRIFKLRTMEYRAAGPPLTALGDPRVTPIGRFLRAWSIDELPQLANVLTGRMTLVGPRPEVPELVACWPDWRRRALDATPGLTGLSQVFGRDELTEEEKGRLDLFYVLNRSFAMDVSILIKTVRSLARYRGRA